MIYKPLKLILDIEFCQYQFVRKYFLAPRFA